VVILGINNMHDASCALMANGQILAAAEEERFSRIKHTTGLPVHAMRYCLDAAGVRAADLDIVVAAWRPWVLRVRATLAMKSLFASTQIFRTKAVRGARQMGHEWRELFMLRGLLERHLGPGRYRVRYLEHHLAHAASAFLCSPFEEAAIMTVDGAGEEDTTVTWHGSGGTIRKLDAVRLPHSLGQLYSATTAFLGFKANHDEYKVMGLAAMGRPKYAPFLLQNVIAFGSDGRFSIKPYFLDYHLARVGGYSEEVTRLFGPPRERNDELTERHADIAASVQHVLEQALFHALRHLHKRTKSRRLGLAGGVALNCTANGKIFSQTPFEQVFVQPAAGDSGTALGAALYWSNQTGPNRTTAPLPHAYWGPNYSRNQIEAALRSQGVSYTELAEEALVERAARLLAEGNVVGWFHGRMEWGPRALGARSLLADPRRAEIKEKINRIIKKREPFRPFAPSVIEERAAEFFDGYQPSPFMLFTFPVKPEKRSDIPAVTHTDGTARPQGVTAQASPRYYRLIKRFAELTGIPMLLNTSFNVDEPIVCSPDDALATFLGNEMNHLVLEEFLIAKPALARAGSPP
jgi:carbamoyltransferase